MPGLARRLRGGLRLLEESAAIAEAVDHAETKATTVVSVGLFNLLKGDVEEAGEKLVTEGRSSIREYTSHFFHKKTAYGVVNAGASYRRDGPRFQARTRPMFLTSRGGSS